MFGKSKLKARIAELEKLVKKQDTNLEMANREHQRLRDKLNQSERKRLEPPAAVTIKRMVGIKLKALFDGKYQPTEFKIGLGKCGKVVHYFEVTKRDADRTLTIHQYHTDGSSKDFEYRLGDIDGRIQYDYELMQVYGEEAERERAIQAFRQVRPRIVI